jgi:hypothetical protein
MVEDDTVVHHIIIIIIIIMFMYVYTHHEPHPLASANGTAAPPAVV